MSEVSAESTPDILASGGWIATALIAAWSWITRFALARHFKQLDELSTAIGNIDKRIARLEGRFEQQDSER